MNKGELTKLRLLRRLMIKVMGEKVKFGNIQCKKNISQILQKIQNLLFTVKIIFFWVGGGAILL